MIDFVFGVLLAVLVVRGWMRGLIREAIGLAVFLGGLFLAFRYADEVGGVIGAMTGSTASLRWAGGIAVFFAVSIVAGGVSYLAHRVIRTLPGLTTMNRLGGAAFAGLWGLAAVTLAVSLLAVAPVPDAVAEALEDSGIAGVVTDPDGIPQQAIGAVTGDQVIRTLLRLHRMAGDGDVGALPPLPPVPDEELALDLAAAEVAFQALNRGRILAGKDPLAWSEHLAGVAAVEALARYSAGKLGADIREAVLEAAPPHVAGEARLLVAVSAEELRDRLAGGGFGGDDLDRGAVAVVNGPYGVVAVVIGIG